MNKVNQSQNDKLYDSTYMRYAENLQKSNSQRQKVEWRQPKSGGMGDFGLLFTRHGASLMQDEKRSTDGWCDSCLTMKALKAIDLHF